MKRIKRYKALPPEETVDNISGILFDRLGVELRITEQNGVSIALLTEIWKFTRSTHCTNYKMYSTYDVC